MLYFEDLEELSPDVPCDDPECDSCSHGRKGAFAFGQFCHPAAGCVVRYQAGAVLVDCYECGSPVVSIAAAHK